MAPVRLAIVAASLTQFRSPAETPPEPFLFIESERYPSRARAASHGLELSKQSLDQCLRTGPKAIPLCCDFQGERCRCDTCSRWRSLARGSRGSPVVGGQRPTRRRESCVSNAPASAADGPLRVCLLSYRSKPHCGGQGIYLRHVSRELAALGHHVEVYSGQPYPELEPGPQLIELPSLDLYCDEDPFRTPHLREYRDWIDVLEVAGMWTAYFPEPLTFSLRALRALRPRAGDFDVVHDNQVLAYGNLGIARLGLPVVTSIHHPISVDRRIELKAARGLRKIPKWRWYSFVGMQGRVARRIGPVMTGSESSRADILRDFKVSPE